MKKIPFTIFFFCFTATIGFAQQSACFRKIIESNYCVSGMIATDADTGDTLNMYNLQSKSALERLFSGDMNAKIEYFIEPWEDPVCQSATSLRIVKDATDTSYLLEVKSIANWKEVQIQIEKEFPSKNTFSTEKQFLAMMTERENMSKEEKELKAIENKIWDERRETERLKRYKITTRSFPVSDLFVTKLHEKLIASMDRIQGVARPCSANDSAVETFRCVVGFELWSLEIHHPREEIGRLSDLCIQIIHDTETEPFDESKYNLLLEK